MATTPVNPANTGAEKPAAFKRIPLTTSRRRLEVPEVSGYRLYWFADRNLERALQAGYEYVSKGEIPVVQRNVASDVRTSGNVDLGGNVKVVGGEDAQGKTEFLTLMKIRQEWYNEDHAEIAKQNARIVEAIFSGEKVLGAENDRPDDAGTRYNNVRGHKALFNRPKRVKKP